MQNGLQGRTMGNTMYQQPGGMNRYQQQPNFTSNANRGNGGVWQQQPQPYQRPQLNNNFQQVNKTTPNVNSNGTAPTTTVQSRLGPSHAPITAPDPGAVKTDGSSRPVLMRPGMDKNTKPAEDKVSTAIEKKVEQSDIKSEMKAVGANAGANAASNKVATNSSTGTPVGINSSQTGATGNVRGPPPNRSTDSPSMGKPAAAGNQENAKNIPPNTNKFGQNQGNQSLPVSTDVNMQKNEKNDSGNSGTGNQNSFGQTQGIARFGGNQGPRFGNQNNQGRENSKFGALNNNQGAGNNNPGGPNNNQGGPNNNQGGPNNNQGGPNNNQGGPNNNQGGPNNNQGGGPNNNQEGGKFGNQSDNNRMNQGGGRFGNSGTQSDNSRNAVKFGNQGPNNSDRDRSDNQYNRGGGRFNNPGQDGDNKFQGGNRQSGGPGDQFDKNQGGKFGGNQGPRDNRNRGNNNSSYNKVRQGPGSGNSGPGNNDGGNKHGGGNRDYRKDGPRNRGGYNTQERLWDKVQEISGPQYDLEPLDMSEKKFNAQSRLFVGSLPRDITLEELKEMFSKHGELGQVYYNKEGAYAFINFDFHANAEKAVRELNATTVHGRAIKVRFAAITTGVRVKNLSSTVTNELLQLAFSVFGAVESSRVSVDDRGKPIGDGIVIFTEKKAAVMAYKKCQEESFFLTSELRPVIVEPWETRDDEEGYPEANIIKNEQYKKDRKVGPRFAEPNSFESDYSKKWKQLFDVYKEKKISLESDLKAEMEGLEVKMALVIHQQETDKLRKELAQREQEALQLQMGLGATFGEPNRSQFGGEEYGPYGAQKRPHDYYDSQGMDPRAQGMDPRAQGMDPRAQGMDPRAQGMDPRAQGMDPRAQGMDPRAGQASMDYRGQGSADYRGQQPPQGSMDYRGQYDQQARGYDDYYRAGASAGYDRAADDRAPPPAGAAPAYGGYDRQSMDQQKPIDRSAGAAPVVPATGGGGAATATATGVSGGGADIPRGPAEAGNPYTQQGGYDQRGADAGAYHQASAGGMKDERGGYNRPPPNVTPAAAAAGPYEGAPQAAPAAGVNPYEAPTKRTRFSH